MSEDHHQKYLNLRPVTRSEVRGRLYRKGDITAWENKALKAVSYEFPEVEVDESFRDQEKCDELLPHVLAVLKCDVIKDEENTLHRYRLLRDAGAYTMTIGDSKVAEELLTRLPCLNKTLWFRIRRISVTFNDACAAANASAGDENEDVGNGASRHAG